MVKTAVRSNIAQIFDVGTYHGFPVSSAGYAASNNHKIFGSSVRVILHSIVAPHALE